MTHKQEGDNAPGLQFPPRGRKEGGGNKRKSKTGLPAPLKLQPRQLWESSPPSWVPPRCWDGKQPHTCSPVIGQQTPGTQISLMLPWESCSRVQPAGKAEVKADKRRKGWASCRSGEGQTEESAEPLPALPSIPGKQEEKPRLSVALGLGPARQGPLGKLPWKMQGEGARDLNSTWDLRWPLASSPGTD